MAFTGNNAFAQEYSGTLLMLSQQKDSRFAPHVTIKTVSGAEAAYFPTIGVADAPTAVTERHGDTPVTEVDINNRKVMPTVWEAGHILDKDDMNRQKIDMQGGYLEADRASFNRKKDIIIRDAAFGIAYTGKNGATSVASLEAESQGINAGNGAGYAAAASVLGTAPAEATYDCGLNLSKLLLMAKLFDEADVDPELARYWAVAFQDVYYMLDITEVGSADYNTVKTLTTGKVDSFMGFKFIPSNRLAKMATGTAYRTFAWAEGGIILAYIGDMQVNAAPDPGKKFNTVLYSKMDLGAVRMEGAKVHECLTHIGADETS